MKIVPYSDDAIIEAVSIIQNGGVIAHATETCYGLACDVSNPDAVAKLFAIKARPEHQPVSALFESVDQAKQYVEWNDRAEELAAQYLPGPLTMILPMRIDAPKTLHPSLAAGSSQLAASLGVRISSSPVAQALIAAYQSPLSTTSANLHGQPNPYSAEDIATQFADHEPKPDLVIDSGILPQNPPSTVMDLSGSEETIRRQGKI